MDIDIPITGTNYYQVVFDRWLRYGMPKDDLHLLRVTDNKHDAHAVSVDYDGYQLGWVAATHSKKVAEQLDLGAKVTKRLLVACRPNDEPMRRLTMRFRLEAPEKADTPGAAPHIVKVFGSASSAPPPDRVKRLAVGTVLGCRTSSGRTSISLTPPSITGPGADLAWFRKEEPGAELSDDLIMWANRGALVARIETQNPLTMSLHRKGNIKEPEAINPSRGIIAAALEEARTRIHTWVGIDPAEKENFSLSTATTRIDDLGNTVITYAHSSTQKETTMNTQKETTMNNFFSRLISINTKAAGDAAYLETGRIANNTVIKMITARLPFMARFYARTPFGKLATANAAIALVQQLRPNDARLQRLTAAMATTAYQEVIQLVDIEGMIDELMANPAIKRALDKLEPTPHAG